MNIVSSTSPDRPAGNVAMKAVSLPTPLIADVRQLIDAARQRVALRFTSK